VPLLAQHVPFNWTADVHKNWLHVVLFSGIIGFLACFWFVRKIYSVVKVDWRTLCTRKSSDASPNIFSHLFSSYFSPALEQIFLTFLKSDFYWSTDLVTQASISSRGTFLLFHKLPCDSEVKNMRGKGCHHVSRLYETYSDCNKYLWMSCKLWIIGLFIRFCLSQQQKNCIENKKTVWTCFKAA